MLQAQFTTPPADHRRLFEQLVELLRSEGIRTTLHRPQQEPGEEFAPHLPAIVEMKTGTFALLDSIADDSGTTFCTLLVPEGDTLQPQRLSSARFSSLWTGALLSFDKVNTALICFTLVALEHKIDLTKERLQHEYNLGRQEIAGPLLLRIAKENEENRSLPATTLLPERRVIICG